MSEWRMNDLERWRTYQRAMALPSFATVEEAADHDGRFVLKTALGSYTVCVGYMGQTRDEPPAWTHREEYSFSHGAAYAAQQRAALSVGMELIGGPE